MSSVDRDAIEDHERLARSIQEFLWEGKPHKSVKLERTKEELEDFLESLRLDAWESYQDGARNLGWTE
jgi:hypothetical protein